MPIMPYMTNGKRDYAKENRLYKSKPDQIKKREERNTARAHEIKAGHAHVGDGKEVDHIKPLGKGGTNSSSNLRVVSAHLNDSFPRNKDGSMKHQNSALRGDHHKVGKALKSHEN